MALKTRPWDTAAHLKTEEDIQLFVEAALEESPHDAAYITHVLGTVARARGMTQLAAKTGISRVGLYKAFAENGNPSFSTVLKVANALGFQIVITDARRARTPAKKSAGRGLKKTSPKRAPVADWRKSA